jgi:hypothetical protein
MTCWRTLRRANHRCRRAVAVLLLLTACGALASAQMQAPPKVAFPKPEPVYAPEANDAWNRIFCLLFSRRMEVRLSDEFPEGSPFTKAGVDANLLHAGHRVSTQTFERTELGDRAIDPLYPGSLDGAAARLVLSDPNYGEFTKALRDAILEKGKRTPLARALMQSDLWSAHDILFVPFLPADEKTLGDRRRLVVDLLARLIRKIALTSDEIKALPDNYSVAMRQYSLPDVFHRESGWIEVQWFSDRQHDRDAGYRRVSRIFVKPMHPPSDMQKFLDERPGQNIADLDGVVLVMQLLLIDDQGNIRPVALTNDVRVLHYDRTPDGTFKKTAMQVWELSRQLLVRDPASAGLTAEEENSPAYAVQNYKFVNNYFETGVGQTQIGPPVQVRLRTRCAACHQDNNLSQVRTFAMAMPPRPPRVKQLNPLSHKEADFDIGEKTKRNDFQSLRESFHGVPASKRPLGSGPQSRLSRVVQAGGDAVHGGADGVVERWSER